jgi:hypothetical protein
MKRPEFIGRNGGRATPQFQKRGVGFFSQSFQFSRLVKTGSSVSRTTLIRNFKFIFHLATVRILKPGETGCLKLIEKAAPDGLLFRNLAWHLHSKDRTDLVKTGDFSLNIGEVCNEGG